MRSTLVRVGHLSLAIALVGAQALPHDLQKTGERTYLFAYPLVLMEVTRRGVVGRVGPNTFVHLSEFPNDTYRFVIRPNADTLYSSAFVDLASEPVLLHVPDTHGRYYLVQVVDAWTNTIATPGKRTTGTQERWFAIVGPGWNGQLPEGVTRIDSSTNLAWLVGRIQTNTAADYSNVHALQRQFWLVPLSLYPNPPPRPPVSLTPNPNVVPPPETVAKMSTKEFFTVFARLLVDSPPHHIDEAVVRELAALGIAAGKPFPDGGLPPAFEQGVARAKQVLEGSANRERFGKTGRTGWFSFDIQTHYGANYPARAALARAALGMNPAEDAVYFACARDAAGAWLDGARKYVMHFDREQLPPVRAFWSVTLYNEAGYFTANPINRFAIGDRDSLKYNSDGSLDLYLQHASPGSALESNWLPAPVERFTLAFRLYWPSEAVLKGKWIPPAVTRTGGTGLQSQNRIVQKRLCDRRIHAR